MSRLGDTKLTYYFDTNHHQQWAPLIAFLWQVSWKDILLIPLNGTFRPTTKNAIKKMIPLIIIIFVRSPHCIGYALTNKRVFSDTTRQQKHTHTHKIVQMNEKRRDSRCK